MMNCNLKILSIFFLIGFMISITIIAKDSHLNSSNIPELKALRINGNAPKIDGQLNDVVWKNYNYELARNFTQRVQDEGQPATESTLVAVAYDDEALYFAFWAYDSEPEKMINQLVRRDRYANTEVVSVRLDPYHDHQTGYWLQVSIAGTKRDFSLFNDDHFDVSWDGIWDAATEIQPWGWSAEFRIPFHCLRFTEKEEHVWGINLTRYIPRNEESDWWAFTPTSEKGFVSLFGHLTGLKGIKPARHFEVLPYSVAQYETEPKNLGNPNGRSSMGNIGLDVKYGITSNLTLDATINPDFGQVELDQPVLNLSAFETYYSEKRPFFLEGADLFRTNFNVFYSRRIGRSPRGDIDDANFEEYIDRPKATTILGAAKLTGKLAGGTSIAFLNAVTEKEKAEYLTSSEQTKESIIEPKANYSVLRIKQDIFNNSNIGGIVTLASQDTHHPAVTGGIDWRLFTRNGKWSFSGQTVFSRVDNENTGYGFQGDISKEAGKHIRGAMGVSVESPELNLNHLGFLSCNDEREVWLWTQYRTNEDWWIFRNTWNNFNIYGTWTFEDVNYSKGWNFNSYFEFTNFWSLGGGYSENYGEYEIWETRGNGLWKNPKRWSWWASLNTDQRKKISFNLNPGSGCNRYGTWWANYVGIEVRPASNMEFSGGINYERTFNVTRWVENLDDGPSIFADLNADEISLNLTASVMLTPNLSWQISGQGIIAALDYNNYRKYEGGEEYSYEDVPEMNHDYNYTALNSTMLLRWEYLPSSTLYLVWTRSRSERDNDVNNLDLSRDIDRYFSAGSENLFLIKASYWMNM